MAVHLGAEFSGWEIKDFVGRGATGVVYRAYSDVLGRPVAVKVLHSVLPGSDASARFQREARAIAQLRHPNIVSVYDFGETDGCPYMVVQYLSGGSLADRIGNGRPLPRQEMLKALREVASALDHAHAQGIVHRDVKPANVLLGDDGAAVLADFGLAKILEGNSVKTASGVTTGTPAYMAPEQVRGAKVGPAADRYALATVAYEMITGHLPFEVDGVLELLYAQAHRPPPPPSSKLEGVPAAVDQVVLKGLAKDPGARWGTATAMVDALEEALNRAPASQPRLPRIRIKSRIKPVEPVVATPVRPARPSHPLLVALILLPMLAGGIAIFAPQSQEPSVGLMNTTVQAGDYLLVAVRHATPGQPVEIVVGTGPDARRVTLQADRNGEVNGWVAIPHDIVTGQHVFQLCVTGACRPFAIVQVTAPPLPVATIGPEVAIAPADSQARSPDGADTTTSSTPPPGQKAGRIPGGGADQALPSPEPGSKTSGRTESTPTPSPTATSSASPTPTSSGPPPPPGPGPLVVTVSGSPSTSARRGTAIGLSGSGFAASKEVAVSITPRWGSSQTLIPAFSPASNGSFARTQVLPTGLPAGPATISACTVGTTACATRTIILT